MRRLATEDRIRRFMEALGEHSETPALAYLTGGATAVLFGWRDSTIDVDIRLEPEDDRLLRALPELKETLEINIEFASPMDFIPVPEGWQRRSPFIAAHKGLSFHHFDLYAQALSKLERGHAQDIEDVGEMLERGLIKPNDAVAYFEKMRPHLYRYPAISPSSMEETVRRFFKR